MNQQHREILDVSICSQCDQAQEDSLHALWGCEKVHEIWNPMFDGVRRDYLGTSTFTDLVSLIGRQTKNLELFAAMAWYIWTRRNKLKNNEKFMWPQTILGTASILFSDFQNPNLASLTNHRSRQTKWKPPDRGEYKTNYDGTVFGDVNEAGLGVLIRNDKGRFMVTLAKKIPFLTQWFYWKL